MNCREAEPGTRKTWNQKKVSHYNFVTVKERMMKSRIGSLSGFLMLTTLYCILDEHNVKAQETYQLTAAGLTQPSIAILLHDGFVIRYVAGQ